MPDFDGAMFVKTTADLAALFNGKRGQLRRLLAIASEECANLSVPDTNSLERHAIDGVRYSGISRTGLMKSLKVLVAEHLYSSR